MLNDLKDLTFSEEGQILGLGAFSKVVKVKLKQDEKDYALK